MRYIDARNIDSLPGRRLVDGERFAFRCHAGLGCFNRCCRNLNLFLYPYDVACLKTRLGIGSDEFLDRYVHVVMRESNHFPDVLLAMSETGERTCPFLTDEGCAVYSDRPDACRTFPVEIGSLYDEVSKKSRPVHFFRPPDFCLGRNEPDQWTVEGWIADQNAGIHYDMTMRWSRVKRLFQRDPWGPEGPRGPKAKMAFMAAYNVDLFRAFVFESSFLKRYRVKPAVLKKIRSEDAAMIRFGFAWIETIVWGIPGKLIRPR